MNQRTGRQGEHWIAYTLEAIGWVPRAESPDLGEDFSVEVPMSQGRPTERFYVQVKTSADMKCLRNGAWSVRVDTRALERYAQSRHPVFLIGVNLRTRHMRWLDLSSELLDRSNNTNDLSALNSNKFRMPPSHEFSDNHFDELQQAVLRAFERRDETFNSPTAMLERKRERIASLDKRIGVEARIVDGKEIYEIYAKESFAAKIKFKLANKDDYQALRESIEFGVENTVDTTYFKATGSPALETMPRDGKITIGQTLTRDRIALGWMKRDNDFGEDCFHNVFEEDASLTRGTSGIEIRLNQPRCPLRINIRWHTNGKLNFEVHVDTSVWENSSIQKLPYFEAMKDWLNRTVKDAQIVFTRRVDGVLASPVILKLTPDKIVSIDSVRKWVNTIGCLKEVCAWANSSLLWQENELSEEEIHSWIRGIKLIRGEEINDRIDKITNNPQSDDKHPDGKDEMFSLMVRADCHVFAWNKLVCNIPVCFEMSNYIFDRNVHGQIISATYQQGSICVATLDKSA